MLYTAENRPAQKKNLFLRSGSHCAAGMQFVRGFLFYGILSSALPLAHVLEAARWSAMLPWRMPMHRQCSRTAEALGTEKNNVLRPWLCLTPTPGCPTNCLAV